MSRVRLTVSHSQESQPSDILTKLDIIEQKLSYLTTQSEVTVSQSQENQQSDVLTKLGVIEQRLNGLKPEVTYEQSPKWWWWWFDDEWWWWWDCGCLKDGSNEGKQCKCVESIKEKFMEMKAKIINNEVIEEEKPQPSQKCGLCGHFWWWDNWWLWGDCCTCFNKGLFSSDIHSNSKITSLKKKLNKLVSAKQGQSQSQDQHVCVSNDMEISEKMVRDIKNTYVSTLGENTTVTVMKSTPKRCEYLLDLHMKPLKINGYTSNSALANAALGSTEIATNEELKKDDYMNLFEIMMEETPNFENNLSRIQVFCDYLMTHGIKGGPVKHYHWDGAEPAVFAVHCQNIGMEPVRFVQTISDGLAKIGIMAKS